MENTEKYEFSWSGLFFVTACCTFLFNIAMKFLDGGSSGILMIISGVSFVLGLIAWGLKIFDKQTGKKKRNNRFAS